MSKAKIGALVFGFLFIAYFALEKFSVPSKIPFQDTTYEVVVKDKTRGGTLVTTYSPGGVPLAGAESHLILLTNNERITDLHAATNRLIQRWAGKAVVVNEKDYFWIDKGRLFYGHFEVSASGVGALIFTRYLREREKTARSGSYSYSNEYFRDLAQSLQTLPEPPRRFQTWF